MVNWHPHIHALVTCGAFTEAGEFIPLPAFDADALLHAWEEAVYPLEVRLHPATLPSWENQISYQSAWNPQQ